MASRCFKCGQDSSRCSCGPAGQAAVSDSVVMYMAGFPAPQDLPPFNPGDGSLPVPTVTSSSITFTAPLTAADVRRVLREVLEELDAKKAAKRKALRERIDTKRKAARAARKAARLAVRAAKAAEREAADAAAEAPRRRRKRRSMEVE